MARRGALTGARDEAAGDDARDRAARDRDGALGHARGLAAADAQRGVTSIAVSSAGADGGAVRARA
jgi:hypothetical protein